MELKNTLSVDDLITYILNQSGYFSELKADMSPENESRLENLGEFINVAKEFVIRNPKGTLEEFLNNISLISDIDVINEHEDKVSLMTIHSAKGLEFPVVFITGLEEGLFPISRAMMYEDQLEEERRACYVAITRAKQKLYMTYAASRPVFGEFKNNKTSRFLSEIPVQYLDIYKQTASEISARFPEFVHLTPKLTPKKSSKSFERIKNAIDVKTNTLNSKPKSKTNVNNNINSNINKHWEIGDIIKHDKWGEGIVLEINGTGKERTLKIKFLDKGKGVKSLSLLYAPIKKVSD